ncbi:glycoside hydrolase family 25 protein [Limibacterium fermenti]|uniref:glycoside hydrolase family 25 protein n=1 Tax=Limibacterium fermenti TaxID=3229863 RepID=UPI003A614D0F
MAKKQYRKTSRRRKKKKSGKSGRIYAVIGLLIAATTLALACIIFLRIWQRDLFHSFEQTPYSDKYFVRGVDVSHHNSFIDWNRLRKDNVSFAYLKSTEGVSHIDRDYIRNYRLAKEAGLKVGAYHFFRFRDEGKRQAEHFIKYAKVLPQDMIPAIDVEHSDVNVASGGRAKRGEVIAELKELEHSLFLYYGKHPVIYTNKDCYKKYIETDFSLNPIWICDLHDEPNVAAGNWVIWQFSHTGNIPGTVNDIDLNYYRYSFYEFRTLLMP